jgi:hypothetical protein
MHIPSSRQHLNALHHVVDHHKDCGTPTTTEAMTIINTEGLDHTETISTGTARTGRRCDSSPPRVLLRKWNGRHEVNDERHEKRREEMLK